MIRNHLTVAALLLAPGCLGDWLAMGPSEPATGPDVMEVSDLDVVMGGLLGPTDLAIDEAGTLYVLDSARSQLHVLPADGAEAETMELEGQPVGLAWGLERLWIPHTTEPVVLAMDPSSHQTQRYTLPNAPADTRLTDIVVTELGLLVLSSFGGPWWFDPTRETWAPLQFELPIGTLYLGAGAGDTVIVADVKHDRALLFEPGAPDYTELGKWGVWEGSFVHPTGVAADSRDRIFIADGLLGVVQVFDTQARYLGTLGRGDQLLNLQHPMGVAVRDDRLWVADAGTGRVVSVEVDDRTSPLSGWEMYERKLPRISLMEGRSTPRTRLEEACWSCHDGSVQPPAPIWNSSLEQHPVTIEPEKDIPQPFILDDDGKMYCGTCHIPHRMEELDDDSGDLEVFLRTPRARSELCLACHPDVIAEVRKLEGPTPEDQLGHLLGDVPGDVARSGAGAIAHEIERVECMDCHSPHGAVGEMLLESDEAAMSGCQRCHEGVSSEHADHTHPVGEPLEDSSAAAALRSRGVFLGAGGEVTCLTCHDIHRSGADSWLTMALENHERCVLCHEDQARLQGNGHDLRDGPQGHVATACLACHDLHEALGPSLQRQGGTRDDPTGCLSCHRRGGESEIAIDPREAHPLFDDNPAPDRLPSVGAKGSMALGAEGAMGCTTCHDPHASPQGGSNEAMLRIPGEAAEGCLACHEDLRPVQGSDHDMRSTDSRWIQRRDDPMERGGFCLACHGMHEGGGWRGLVSPAGGTPGLDASTAACLGCHEQGNAADGTVVEVFEHPEDLLLTTAKLPWDNSGELPLYDDAGNRTEDNDLGAITCMTCHNPHVWSPKKGDASGHGDGDTQSSFLRDGWEGFCSGCHGEEALEVYRYFHDPERREEIRKRHERRDWNLYQEDGE
jgi:predicted CXXCH cytochrome family protein